MIKHWRHTNNRDWTRVTHRLRNFIAPNKINFSIASKLRLAVNWCLEYSIISKHIMQDIKGKESLPFQFSIFWISMKSIEIWLAYQILAKALLSCLRLSPYGYDTANNICKDLFFLWLFRTGYWSMWPS